MRIKLYSWSGVPNFGDSLSRVIVSWISGSNIVAVEHSSSCKLLAVGSIIQYFQDGDIVWGSGIHPESYDQFRKARPNAALSIHLLAVRGPITRDACLARGFDCPAVYGDPAVLLPLAYPAARTFEDQTVLIPHFNDFKYFAERPEARCNLPLIDPTQNWEIVVKNIVRAKKVISTSLHGIIVAEAYGIPVNWFRPSHGEGYIKYEDYYSSTGRAGRPIFDLREAIRADTPPVPDFLAMREGLLAAYDASRIIDTCGQI